MMLFSTRKKAVFDTFQKTRNDWKERYGEPRAAAKITNKLVDTA